MKSLPQRHRASMAAVATASKYCYWRLSPENYVGTTLLRHAFIASTLRLVRSSAIEDRVGLAANASIVSPWLTSPHRTVPSRRGSTHNRTHAESDSYFESATSRRAVNLPAQLEAIVQKDATISRVLQRKHTYTGWTSSNSNAKSN